MTGGSRALLGVEPTGSYGPELGILGLASNVVFAVVLWRWWNGRAGAWRGQRAFAGQGGQ